MKLPQELVNHIIQGTMRQLWESFIALDGEYEEFEQDYDMVRFGVNVYFEIYDLWEETPNIARKDKDGKVYINGKTCSLEDFRTEKEERRKIMVEALLNNVKEIEVIAPR